MPSRTYIAIDLKSFYASVECADRLFLFEVVQTVRLVNAPLR